MHLFQYIFDTIPISLSKELLQLHDLFIFERFFYFYIRVSMMSRNILDVILTVLFFSVLFL